jgi:ferredoxin-like protein FixX
MVDTPAVHIGDNSSEHIAYKLTERIAECEKRALHINPAAGWTPADRKWLLDTYSECLEAVRGRRASRASR